MQELKAKADKYLRRAADFAAQAETAADAQARGELNTLAESYVRLSRKVLRLASASDDEIEALARRIVQK